MKSEQKAVVTVSKSNTISSLHTKLCLIAVGFVCLICFPVHAEESKNSDTSTKDLTNQLTEIENSRAKIEVHGEQITYDGAINSENNERLFGIYDEQKSKPNTLVITSVSATIEDAMSLAEWMIKEQLRLHIPDVCAGFCATYAFAAATSVTLNETAVVAWPGNSPTYHDLVAGTSADKPYWEMIRQSFQTMGGDDSEVDAYWYSVRERHREVFKKTAVDPLIALAQFVASPESRRSMQQQGQRGPLTYTLSLADIQMFGRDNVSVINDKTYRPQDNEQYGDNLLSLTLVSDAKSKLAKMHATIASKFKLVESGENIYTDKHVIYYYGEITTRRNQRLFELYEKLDPKPETLSITSPGGDVVDGMDLGDWIFAKKLKVRIPELCGSSCANYVLTASHSTELAETAIVFWHGSPIGTDLSIGEAHEAQYRLHVREDIKLSGDGGDDPDAYWESVRKRNRDFFKKIGVNPLITVLSSYADVSGRKALSKFESYREYGAYVTLENFPVFDINNVTVEEEKTWNPSDNPLFDSGYVEINLAENVEILLKQSADKLAKFD